jgi:hypothetical protein
MDQKSIMLYLSLKEMTAVEIHAGLVATLKTEAACDASATRYLRSRSFTASIDPGKANHQIRSSLNWIRQFWLPWKSSLSPRFASSHKQPI